MVLSFALHIAAVAAADEPAAPKFDVLEYRISGNKLLTRIQIEEAVYPFMGESKSLDDVEAARAKLESTYHDLGYLSVSVDIPEQQVDGGVVTLKVVEAPIGRLRITGSRYYVHGHIRETTPSLAEGSVPNFNAVQQELAQLNRTSDRRVTPVLAPSTIPGMVDVELKVDDQLPLHGSVELNNRYSANTSHTRAVGQLRYGNLFQRDHSISFQYQIAPENPDDSRVWSLSYVIPTQSGSTWAFYAVEAKSNVAVLSSISVIGNGNIYGARWIQPLPQRQNFFHSLTLGVDYKDFKENILLQGADSIATPVAYAPLSAQYSATRLSGTNKRRHRTVFDTGVGFLIRGLVADQQQFSNKRYGAGTSYMTFRSGLQHEFTQVGLGSIYAKGDFQLASGPLISNEQFGAGGADSVRGYTEFECLGDVGARASIEARKPVAVGKSRNDDAQSRVYAFFDTASLETLEPLPGQRSRCRPSSAGLGARYQLDGLSLNVDLTRALQDGNVTRSGDMRILFRAAYEF
ncbi:MAG: ShlB/FhaC/HecB family hemolysin secretion/activation protein [Burkholderiales bacterium]|nr:ShlB/FhaC/HecB family hemolysin secretion/activation protein [Burkholderiales bacterium]